MNLPSLTKKELQNLALYYGASLPYSMRKNDMIAELEALLKKDEDVQTEMELEEVPMSARVKRIKESNSGN